MPENTKVMDDLIQTIRDSQPVRNRRAVNTVWAVMDYDKTLYGLFATEAVAKRYVERHADRDELYINDEVVWG